MSTYPEPGPSAALRAVQALRAEEEPWLESVYVAPAAIGDYLSEQSMIFFGRSGSGRTALRMELARRANQTPGQDILFVHWLPEAPREALTGNLLAQYAMRQVIGAWVEALLVSLVRNPPRLRQLAPFLRSGLVFLFQEYLPVDPQFYLLSRTHELPAEGVAEMQALLVVPPAKLLRPEATTQTLINLIAATLQQIGFTATWVLVDGLEKWQRGLRVQNRDMLGAMLDTLNYFDRKDIVFKVFALEEFSGLYRSLGGVDRYRLYPHELSWPVEELYTMLNLRIDRLAPAAGVRIETICADTAFLGWLRNYAGQTPRWWLLLSRPFFAAYMDANPTPGSRTPLSSSVWRTIAAQTPPPLHIHYDTRQVLLGERAVKVAPSGLNILMFLHQNAQRLCTREELYYLAVCGLTSIPERDEEFWEADESWTSRLDTILWRLRKDIEANPAQPVYLDTARGKGIQLRNAWL